MLELMGELELQLCLVSIIFDFNDDAGLLYRPSFGLVKALSPLGEQTTLNVQQVNTDYSVVQALFYDVPDRLIQYVHQPFHAALDDAYVETKTPAEVFLDPNNIFGFKTPSLKPFAKRFEEQLSILRKADDPSELEAASLSDARLGRAIVQRQPNRVAFIGMLIEAEQKWVARSLLDDCSLG